MTGCDGQDQTGNGNKNFLFLQRSGAHFGLEPVATLICSMKSDKALWTRIWKSFSEIIGKNSRTQSLGFLGSKISFYMIHWNLKVCIVKIEITSMVTAKWIDEMVPYFFQFSQNLTSDCLLISVYLPVFAWFDHKIVLFWSAGQFYDHNMWKKVKTGKKQKSTNNPMPTLAWWYKIWTCLIFIKQLSCTLKWNCFF